MGGFVEIEIWPCEDCAHAGHKHKRVER